MKFLALLAAFASLASAQISGNPDLYPSETGQLPAGFEWSPKMPAVSSVTGGRIVKVRYGAKILMANGHIWNNIAIIANPCSSLGTCYLTQIQAGLEYADGKNANVDTGAWMHHMVLLHTRSILSGNSIGDTFCAPIWPRRFFASGNERTNVQGPRGYGIRIESSDTWIMIVDLMNDIAEMKIVYPTVTYEIVSGALAIAGMRETQLFWVDITGCGISEYPARSGYYELQTPSMTSPIAGQLVYAGGHVHDGGLRFVMYHNDRVICTAEHIYGRLPEYKSHHGLHISDASVCLQLSGAVRVGDRFRGVAIYNSTKWPQMEHDGSVHNIMGIGNIFVATGKQG